MDLATLEAEYLSHVAGASRDRLPPVELPPQVALPPVDSAVSVWNQAATTAHVDLRGLFDLPDAAQLAVGSPMKKVGLNISAPNDEPEPVSVGVSSPVVTAATPPDDFKKFGAPEIGFVEWTPSR